MEFLQLNIVSVDINPGQEIYWHEIYEKSERKKKSSQGNSMNANNAAKK